MRIEQVKRAKRKTFVVFDDLNESICYYYVETKELYITYHKVISIKQIKELIKELEKL